MEAISPKIVSTYTNGGGIGLPVASDPKLTLINNGLKTQMLTTHNGLKLVKSIKDISQLRAHANKLSSDNYHVNHVYNNLNNNNVINCGMRLVFVGAEVAPWSKTGGLGDVLGGLPPALAARGHRVMTVSPRYDQYRDGWDTSVVIELKVGDRFEKVRFFHCIKRGVDRVFVDHPIFLARVWGKTESKLYGPTAGVDYDDNQLRFSLLCQAALEAPRILNLNNRNYSGPYGEDVLFVANDWHTALLPCYLKTVYQPRGLYRNAKVAFCIHNIVYQGRFAYSDFQLLNLPEELRGAFEFLDGNNKPVKGLKINWMKAGIQESDTVVTVSPYYAQELMSSVERGVELDQIIRRKGVTGIVNGMDVQEWNPSTDKFISTNYNAATVMNAKPLLKEALQAEVGLPVDRNIPLIGFIGRLEEQKGSDILAEAIPQFVQENNVQIIVLGTGKKEMENQIQQLEVLYPNNARGVTKFNVPLAHMMVAGADFMLIPSRFEPCGLIQLSAMPYGTLPIVASTGGLVDTVKEGYTGFHMGRLSANCDVVDPADINAVATAVTRAVSMYGTPAFNQMILNCMAQDFSWKEPAKRWEQLLLSLDVTGSQLGNEGIEATPLALENIATP